METDETTHAPRKNKRLITLIRRSGLTPMQVQNGLINQKSETGFLFVVGKGRAVCSAVPKRAKGAEALGFYFSLAR